MNNDFHNAGVIFIKDKRILVVKPIDRDNYIIPGGAIENGEAAMDAAVREVEEELGIKLKPGDLTDLGNYSATAVGFADGRMVHIHLFMVDEWDESEVGLRDGEIEDEAWIDSTNYREIKIGNVLREKIIPELKSKSLIN